MIKITVFTGLMILMLSGCYRMPGDDEYSVIPATNNPDVCRDRGSTSGMPGAGF